MLLLEWEPETLGPKVVSFQKGRALVSFMSSSLEFKFKLKLPALESQILHRSSWKFCSMPSF